MLQFCARRTRGQGCIVLLIPLTLPQQRSHRKRQYPTMSLAISVHLFYDEASQLHRKKCSFGAG